MFKFFRFRIYPNKEQQKRIEKTFSCVRFIYNKMLEARINHYKATGRYLYNKPSQYLSQYPWLTEIDGLALVYAKLNLDAAFRKFFSSPKVNHPKFKSKGNSHLSYSTANQNGSVIVENGRITLPKVGSVKMRQHRQLPENGKIKTVVISRLPSNKYFVSVLIQYKNQVLPVTVATFLGLDFSTKGLYVDSEGNSTDYPGYYKTSLAKITRLSKILSKCRTNSKNREKAKLKLARLQEHITNQRKDYLDKLSAKLASKYDCISVENLDIQAIGQKRNLGKSVSDNSWRMFSDMLEYKLKDSGKRLIRINRYFPSSQLCHVCHYRNDSTKNLSIREWTCPVCRTHHNRDFNAAINIRNEGKRLASA